MVERIQPVAPTTSETPVSSTNASTARFTVPAEGFVLAELFERVSDARVECKPALASSLDHELVVIRTDEHKKDVDAALQSDAGIGEVECFGECAGGWTYRITWKGRPRRLLQQFVTRDVTLLSARGRDSTWKFHLAAPNREKISQASNVMDDLDCGAECRNLSAFDGEETNRSKLTSKQQGALISAFEMGYYDVPQNVSLKDVATDLGISHQALSERLHRAYHHIIESEFVVNDENQF